MRRRLSSGPVDRSVKVRSIVEPLAGILVADFTRYLPGPFASRELLERGARVVRVETPEGDPLREVAPGWDAALNAGKESVVWDLERDPELGRKLSAQADVVLEGFRPGVAERLGIAARDVPDSVVYCSITGFGAGDRRAGHDLNYEGWAGLLADTAPALPPLPIADIAGGALYAVVEILAALLERERTGRGRRITVSMTHNAHRLAAHRLRGEPERTLTGGLAGYRIYRTAARRVPTGTPREAQRLRGEPERTLTGGLACYRIYRTADDRFLTVTPVEPKFWRRLCELIGRTDLVERQYGPDQDALAAELAGVFGQRHLVEWLELFEGADVMVGPVATLAEAAEWLGTAAPQRPAPRLGEHTEAWRASIEG